MDQSEKGGGALLLFPCFTAVYLYNDIFTVVDHPDLL
jgi:hypothetical protein